MCAYRRPISLGLAALLTVATLIHVDVLLFVVSAI